MSNAQHTPGTKRAIKNYGEAACIEAYNLHMEGCGASTVANLFNLNNIKTTRQADAAINAGRDLVQNAAIAKAKGTL